MRLSKCCDAEVKFGMVDDNVGHGMHEETECSNCGELFPEVYDDEEIPETRSTWVTIHGRKEPGYPSVTFTVIFENVEQLVAKIDKLIEEETDFRKVDVYLEDDSIFDDSEIERLELENIYFN